MIDDIHSKIFLFFLSRHFKLVVIVREELDHREESGTLVCIVKRMVLGK